MKQRSAKQRTNVPGKKAKSNNIVAKARRPRKKSQSSKRSMRGQRDEMLPFAPPEDWYEPTGGSGDYQVVVQPPGEGYRHILSEADIRTRLGELPKRFLERLEVVQLSRMTRKKRSFPCYGMQWGCTLYLYPLEESLTEYFYAPPRPNFVNETRMYGAKWDNREAGIWRLLWNEQTIRDYYLNNILIHELGHLLDDRNTSYVDRERYAEDFAIQYGYRTTQRERKDRRIVRRHHAC